MLKRITKHAVIGLLIGSLTFLVLIVVAGKPVYVTPLRTINVLLLGMLIGILSMIFDVERLNFTYALCIHYIGVLLLVGSMDVLNHWWINSELHIWYFIAGTTFVYIIVWWSLHLMSVINVRKINEHIQKKRQDNN